jgi:hypothetical protein
MIREEGSDRRALREETIECDLAVVGGGLAGVCCAITAARAGLKVTLVQDRPVLGGNASSEVRLWVLGATSHMGNNNRWAREGGVVDEILLENTHRNPQGNAIIFDTVLLDKVVSEPNIRLLLNTAMFEIEKESPDRIRAVRCLCSQNSIIYRVLAPLFCDASGDGVLGFLAGAAFRIGAEQQAEFGEQLAPDEEYGHLLGHSIFFYSRDTGRPVKYVPPSYALTDISKIPRYRNLNAKDYGSQLWWLEYGGRLDTIHDTEAIKWELWRVVYGVWNYVKNSGNFPEAENLTLEWVGTIPGKRESRRFEGDYMLTQHDVVEQRQHPDAVSFGGWAIDLHPADGVFSEKPGCTQWHSKGVYQIPYRSLYSRNIDNLFLAGRIISATHVAFGSTRVMATCGHNAQAVGMAAALCKKLGVPPRALNAPEHLASLQKDLLNTGHYIPHVALNDSDDLAKSARVSESSRLTLNRFDADGPWLRLDDSWGMLLPIAAQQVPRIRFQVQCTHATQLRCELRACSRLGSFTPDVVLDTQNVELLPATSRIPRPHLAVETTSVRQKALVAAGAYASSAKEANGSSDRNGNGSLNDDLYDGPSPFFSLPDGLSTKEHTAGTETQHVEVQFAHRSAEPQYLLFCLMANPAVSVRCSTQRVTGILSVTNRTHKRVSVSAVQSPPPSIGIDTFEFWRPLRRPEGHNLAIELDPPLDTFSSAHVTSGVTRPTIKPNAWVADWDDPHPVLRLHWDAPQTIARVVLSFDTDFDHPLESILMGHPESVMPLCVRNYRIYDDQGAVVYEQCDNYQTRNEIRFSSPLETRELRLVLEHPHPQIPASLFAIRCYSS